MSAAKAKKRGWLVFIPADPSKEIYREGFSERAAPYERLRDAVGGLIQPVKLRYRGRARDGYVNEEGLLRGLPPNWRATQMWCLPTGKGEYLARGQILVGDAVLVYWEKVAA